VLIGRRESRTYCLSPPAVDDTPGRRVFWLQQALGDEAVSDERILEGRLEADVCIVGGGFTGLWTAIRLREQDPRLSVVLLEADMCGSGASGRNGGSANGWWAKFPSLVKGVGVDEAKRLVLASIDAVDTICRFCDDHHINAQFVRDGFLWTATSEAQMGAWQPVVDAAAGAGMTPFKVLDRSEVIARTGSPKHLGGVIDPSGATVQPAALARGLRRVARSLGVDVFEKSAVFRVITGPRIELHTQNSVVSAERVVLAANAWLASSSEFRPHLIVVSSDVIATEPVPERLAEVGYTSRGIVGNSRMLVDYYRTTQDGRIVFGRGGGTLAYKGRIGSAFTVSERQTKRVRADFRDLLPHFRDVHISHSWAGAVDRSMTGLPWFPTLLDDARIRCAVGYSGNGVGPCVVGGRILASYMLGREDEWTAVGDSLNRIQRTPWPPEPIRYVGGRLVQTAIARKEHAENGGRKPSQISSFLARLSPTSVIDMARPLPTSANDAAHHDTQAVGR
jgi:glycine/D-amino acid oxidase-like deaminating enzyme